MAITIEMFEACAVAPPVKDKPRYQGSQGQAYDPFWVIEEKATEYNVVDNPLTWVDPETNLLQGKFMDGKDPLPSIQVVDPNTNEKPKSMVNGNFLAPSHVITPGLHYTVSSPDVDRLPDLRRNDRAKVLFERSIRMPLPGTILVMEEATQRI